MMINRTSYEKLIAEDIEWLEINTEDSLERRHIIDVLKASTELIYGKE